MRKTNAVLQFRATRVTNTPHFHSHTSMNPPSLASTHSLSSSIYPALKAAVIEHWCSGLGSSQGCLAVSMGHALGVDGDRLARRLTPFLRRLRDRGIYVAQRSAFGSKGADMVAEHRTSPHSFNWSPIPSDTATLADVVQGYLAAPREKVSDSAKSAFRSSMRLLMDLPTRCSDAVIVSAAKRHVAERLYFLPEQVYSLATAAPNGLAPQTASNHRAALRAAMRYCAMHDLVPMVFPSIWPDDPWSESENRYWPMSTKGPTPTRLLNFRTAYRAYRDGCRSLFGAEVLPTSITPQQVGEVVKFVQYGQGRLQIGYNVRRALRDIAVRFGEGPLANVAAISENAPYLRGPNGESGEGSLRSFLALLKLHGVPVETRAFMRWYSRYVTMDPLALLRSERYPPRRSNQRLKDVTFQSRISALRMMLGVATIRLGLPAESLTPQVIFGTQFKRIVGELERWWLERAATLPAGSPGSAKAGGVRQHVINLGLLALACYELSRFQSGKTVATRDAKDGERIDVRAEQLAEMSTEERRYWDAYRHANNVADALADNAKGTKGKRGMDRMNEMRDLKRMFRTTPPSWWIALLDALINEVREAKRTGDCERIAYHNLVLNAFTLGAYISTGFRDGEMCTVRLDIHFSPELLARREIALRAIDRKNGKPQTARLHEEYVPNDILNEYLKRTRPFFMARLAKTRSADSPLVSHPFLLVNTEGLPYGCIEEQLDGRGRNELAFKARVAKHGQRFRQQFLRIAARLGLATTGNTYEFGLHPIRNVCGYAIYHLLGETAAANYLGDKPAQVLKSYAAIDGLMVNSATMKGMVVDEALTAGLQKERGASATAPGTQATTTATGDAADGYADEMEALLRVYRAGEIDAEDFQLMKRRLKERSGRAA